MASIAGGARPVFFLLRFEPCVAGRLILGVVLPGAGEGVDLVSFASFIVSPRRGHRRQ